METWISRRPVRPIPTEGEGASVDITRLLNIFRRRQAIFWIVIAEVVAATFVLVMQMTPVYTSTASVVLDQRKQDLIGDDKVLSDLPPESSVVDTEVEVLKSWDLAAHVVKALDLVEDKEFNRGFEKGSQAAPTPEEVQKTVTAVSRHLKVSRVGTSYLINVSFTSKSPEKAAAIANTFANEYLRGQLETKFKATKRANDWLYGQIQELQTHVRDSDEAVQAFKAEHNLLGAGGATLGATLNEQQAASMDKSLADARAQLAEREARYAAAQASLAKGGTGEDLEEAMNSPVIQNLRVELSRATQNIAQLRNKLGESHPTMINARQELQSVKDLMAIELKRVIAGMKAQVDVARAHAQALEERMKQTQGVLANNNQASVQLRQLEQKAESARAMYASYLDRYLQTSSQEGMQQSDARLVSAAAVPIAPSAPKKKLSLALGLVVGMVLGALCVFVREALDSSVSTADEVEQRLGLPYLASIPLLSSTLVKRKKKAPAVPPPQSLWSRLGAGARQAIKWSGAKLWKLLLEIFTHPPPNSAARLQPAEYVLRRPFASFTEGFRTLRTALKLSKSAQPGRVVAITSSLPREGKTTTSLCLARVLGLAGLSVVVVDCDLRRKGVRRILSGEPDIGLVEVVLGGAALRDALVPDCVPGVSYLPLVNSGVTANDVFGSEGMVTLLKELRTRFNVVLLDSPPVLAVSDTGLIAPLADSVVLLAQWRRTPAKAIEAALRVLHSVGGHVAGVALTQVDQRRQAREGYGDAGYYFNEYKEYYHS